MTALIPEHSVTTLANPAKPGPGHLNYLDGLRGLAAIYVMFHHAWLTVWTDPAHFPTGLTGHLTYFLQFGMMAVTIFIVLSGFCLMLPVVRAGGQLRGGALAFFKRRARRILPPYYFALALSCILLLTLIGKPTGTHWDVSIPRDTSQWIEGLCTHILLIEDFDDAFRLNHVFWSVSVEWQIYFFFPILLIAWRQCGPRVTTLGMLLLAFAAANLADGTRLQQVHPHYLGLFTLGMMGAQIAFSQHGPMAAARRCIPWRTIGAAAAASVAVFCAIGLNSFLGHKLIAEFLVGVATVSLLISSATPVRHPIRNLLSLKPIVWIGTFSYSLYLIHAPPLQIVWQYLIHPLNLGQNATFSLLCIVGGPLIVAASYLFYLVCERPFLNTPPPKLTESKAPALAAESLQTA
jgi:peptidoglycan/LPS O-acetylase OafA/YrhL